MPKSHKKQDGLTDTWGRRNRKLQDKPCLECGKIFRPARATSQYCSRRCAWANNGGRNKKPVSWWKNSKGYIEGKIWIDNETQIRVKQHRFVMEGLLGRPLKSWEDVHHKDGCKHNNEPSNLQVISHGEHTRLTNAERDYKKGYSLNITDEERKARSMRAIYTRLSEIGRAAIAKAEGGAYDK